MSETLQTLQLAYGKALYLADLNMREAGLFRQQIEAFAQAAAERNASAPDPAAQPAPTAVEAAPHAGPRRGPRKPRDPDAPPYRPIHLVFENPAHGVFSQIARDLSVTPGLVRRVALGQTTSARVKEALLAEASRTVERLLKSKEVA